MHKAGFREDIQGIRALSVLLVVLFHADLIFEAGYLGVDVFFVVSGFVITRHFIRELESKSFSIFSFYKKRIRRLLPAHAFMVLSVVIISGVLASPNGVQQRIALTGISSLLITANFVIPRIFGGYFDAPAAANPLLHTWSLSVEEQFYLIFPLVFLGAYWFGRARGGRFGLLTAVLSLLGVGSLILWILNGSLGGLFVEGVFGYFGTLSRVWQFLVGAISTLLLRLNGSLPMRLSNVLSTLTLVLLPLLMIREWGMEGTNQFGSVVVTAMAGLFLFANEQSHSIPTMLLTNRFSRWIGDRSYSIYLWHWPLIVFSSTLFPDKGSAKIIAAALSLAPASWSYRYLEPGRPGGSGQTKILSLSLIAVLVSAGIIASGFLGFGARNRWWLDWSTVSSQQRIAQERGCLDAEFDEESCTWRVSGSKGRILLVGDSQAYALADGVIAAGAEFGLDVTVSSRSGCPFLGLTSTGEKSIDCPGWQAEMRRFVVERRPDIVMIANRSVAYSTPGFGWRLIVDDNGVPAGPENALELYEEGLRRVVVEAENTGSEVIIVANPPEPLEMLAPESIFRRFFNDFGKRIPRADVDEHRNLVLKVERDVASAHDAIVVDPAAELCNNDGCPLFLDGKAVFQDETHLSSHGSLRLSRMFSSLVNEVLAESVSE